MLCLCEWFLTFRMSCGHPQGQAFLRRLLLFYITNEMQLILCSLLLSALYMFQAVFPPIIRSSGAYKTVCAVLGIVMLSCCLLLVF